MRKTIYRIMVQMPGQGIERALPYRIEEILTAEQTAEALNLMLEPEYHHYVQSAVEIHPLGERNGIRRQV